MVWMRTGKQMGGKMATAMQRRGHFVARPCLRADFAHGQFADMDGSRLWTVCGHFAFAAAACPRTVEAVACAWTRIGRGHDCLRGLHADTDCSRTRIVCVRVLSSAESSLWICRVCGQVPVTVRGCSAPVSRPCRGLNNLPSGRSKACPVLNMMGYTLPPRLAQLVPPVFQLRCDRFNAGGLFNGADLDAPSVIVTKW